MAKYDYKALSNIEEKINRVLTKLAVTPDRPVNEAIKAKNNFYLTTAKYKDEKVLFKARIADHRVLQQWGKNFRNERRFLRTLKKYDPNNPLIKRLPVYVKSQINSTEWLMCKFIEEKPAGIASYKYEKPNKEDLKKIIKLLTEIQKFPILQFCQRHTWTKTIARAGFEKYHDFFRKIVRLRKKELLTLLSADMLETANDILLSNREFLDMHCTLFAHGDFHPANIFVNGSAIAIDWEELHVDNASCDISDLWFRMVDHQRLRRFLLLEFARVTKQKAEFPQLFRLNLLARLPDEITTWMHIIKASDPSSELHLHAQKAIKICYSNYISALKGVELNKYE